VGSEATFLVRVSPIADSDAEELADLSVQLLAELLQLDLLAVAPLEPGVPPEARHDSGPADTRKGIEALVAAGHWLAVRVGATGLRSVLAALADWAARSNREVEVGVTVGSDTRTLKLSRATPEQQEKIIDAWLATLPAST
jgi:hypothetical protein